MANLLDKAKSILAGLIFCYNNVHKGGAYRQTRKVLKQQWYHLPADVRYEACLQSGPPPSEVRP